MRAQAYATPDDIDVSSLGSALKRSLKKTLLFTALAGALTFLALSMMAPRYASESQLSIVARGGANPFSAPRQDGTVGDTVNVRMDKEAINTHVRALQSPELALVIAKRLKLEERPEFNNVLGSIDMFDRLSRMLGLGGPVKGQSVDDRVLNAFFDRLNVYSPKESRLIVIRFVSIDPKLAAQVPNALAGEYRKSIANRTVVETDDVQKALVPEIDRLMKEAADAQAAVERFRGEANLFTGSRESSGLNEQQLGELTAELTRAKADQSTAEARKRSAREMLISGSADALPDVQRSPLIQNLVQQRVRVERQISELSATLLPGHPRMRQLNADLTGLKRQIKVEVEKVVDSLDKEAKVAALRVASISRSLDEMKARIVDTGPNEVKLRNLQATAKSKRAELERLQAQYESNRARAESRAVPVEAQVISRARVPSVPVAPKKIPYTLLVAFATLLIGLALSILGAFWTGARANSPSVTPRGSQGIPTLAGSGASNKVTPISSPGIAAASLTAAPLAIDDQPHANVADQEPNSDAEIGSEPQFEPEPEVIPEPAVETMPDGVSLASTGAAKMRSVSDVVDRLAAVKNATGLRTLVTSDIVNVRSDRDAKAMAKALARRGASVLLIDWALSGAGLAKALNKAISPGFNELVTGSATFQDTIQVLSDIDVHLIASGVAVSNSADVLDPDRLNLVLDALDEAYDHIIVVAENADARQLFEAIEGRFDAGVTVAEPKGAVAVIQDPPGTFLGYQVADIELITLEREAAEDMVPGRSLMRSMRSKLEVTYPTA